MKYTEYIQNTINQALFNQTGEHNNNLVYDIIIPVFDGLTELVICINSLLRFTNFKHNIYLYNDASVDLQVVIYLDDLANKYQHISVIHQSINKGYLRNINQALLATKNDVIVLNADTQVTNNWLDEMTLVAQSPRV
ncbi:hypothetical protein MNBD_GAMMA01-2072 [hydrothermal vent metagenome]|uniref:Glycosyltransferase 2-like domain-containing protein n=1 Tax=hydrothermal vent metagenome TaxID=652676 RepID=A0A3B0VD96_9ZZZZ